MVDWDDVLPSTDVGDHAPLELVVAPIGAAEGEHAVEADDAPGAGALFILYTRRRLPVWNFPIPAPNYRDRKDEILAACRMREFRASKRDEAASCSTTTVNAVLEKLRKAGLLLDHKRQIQAVPTKGGGLTLSTKGIAPKQPVPLPLMQ